MLIWHLYGNIFYSIGNYYSNGRSKFVWIHKTLLDSTQGVLDQLKHHKMQVCRNIPVMKNTVSIKIRNINDKHVYTICDKITISSIRIQEVLRKKRRKWKQYSRKSKVRIPININIWGTAIFTITYSTGILTGIPCHLHRKHFCMYITYTIRRRIGIVQLHVLPWITLREKTQV